MALLVKNKINQFGVKEEYWRIVKVNIDLIYNFCDITIASYHNKDARDNDLEPMNLHKVRAKWSPEEFEAFFSAKVLSESSTNIYEQAYAYIKSKDPMFLDAIDC